MYKTCCEFFESSSIPRKITNKTNESAVNYCFTRKFTSQSERREKFITCFIRIFSFMIISLTPEFFNGFLSSGKNLWHYQREAFRGLRHVRDRELTCIFDVPSASDISLYMWVISSKTPSPLRSG